MSFTKIFWLLKKSLRFCFWYIFVNILVLSVSTIISLATHVVNKNIVNMLIDSTTFGEINGIFIGFVIIYMILYFIEKANSFLMVFGNNFFRLNVDELFHKIFMWRSYNTPQEKFLDNEFMEKYTFVSRNTYKISSYINNLSNLLFSNIASVVGTMVLFVIYEPLLIFYSVIIAVIYIFLNGYLSKKEYELDKKQIKEQRYHDYYKELLTEKSYAKELRLYQSKSVIYSKWLRVYEKLRIERLNLSIHKAKLYNIYDLVRHVLRIVAIILLLIGVYNLRYDVGTFVLLFGLIETCSSQINGLVSTVISGAYKDVKYLCDYYDFVMPISDNEIILLQSEPSKEQLLPYGSFNELKVQNVSFTYPNGDRKSVDNVALSIKKGQIVSILGYNGSGKTTLAKLMNGSLISQEGTVTLNGVPICEENKAEIFQYFGFSPQEISRFSLPIKEFVGLGFIEKMHNEIEVTKAYEKSGLKSLVNKMPKSDETILGKEYDEEGIDLSGGEWQRLSIAGAYMGEHEILLMDEPTASIDPLKEVEFINSIRENLIGKTAILISHRISFARLADRIIIMQDGKIVEEGTHDELILNDGYYKKLFKEQKRLYEEVTA